MKVPSRKKSSLIHAIKLTGKYAPRFKRDPNAGDEFLDDVFSEQEDSDATVRILRNFFLALREAWLDTDSLYPYDRYMLTAAGALDLILLPVIIPLGVTDTPLFVALLLLVISIVFVGIALFVAFVKAQAGNTRYGKVHGAFIGLALVTSAGATAAMLLHVNKAIGIVFFVLAVVAYLGCTFYLVLVRIGMRYVELEEKTSPEAPTTEASSESEL